MGSHVGLGFVTYGLRGPITTCSHRFHNIVKFHLRLTTLGTRVAQRRVVNEHDVILKWPKFLYYHNKVVWNMASFLLRRSREHETNIAFIILLSEVGPPNITVKCWELSQNLSLPMDNFPNIQLSYSMNPLNELLRLSNVMTSPQLSISNIFEST